MSKIKVAFLGTGGIMGRHASLLKTMPDVKIVALCDVKEEICRQFLQRNLADYATQPALYTDPDRMYQKSRPDAVFIATPHTLHFQHSVQALAAGCHIYLEKPMVTSLDHAYQLEAKVQAAGKIFVIGYNSPCSPEFAYLRETIHNQTLGKLEVVSGVLSQDWLRLTVGMWRQNPALSGGGMAYDSGAHLLNSLCWSVAADIDTVFAFMDNHATPVDINSAFVIKFANGVLASLAIAGNCPPPVWSAHMSFCFDNGRIDIDGWNGNWIKVWKGNQEIKYPPITPEMGAPSPTHNFIAAVQGKAQPRTSPRNGIIQSQLMDALYESVRTGLPARPSRRA